MKMLFSQLNLSPEISKALHMCGYTTPTPIQSAAIPEVLKKKDIVACAQTGTGKTAAFMLPALHQLSLAPAGGKPRILVLTPTRELATQITDAAHKYGKFLRFNMVSLVGGMPYRQQLKGLSRPVDVIIATPGRLMDHMENGRLDLSKIEMLILDEADRMLDMGFIDDVKYIAKATPKTKQTLLFSATVDDRLSGIIKQLLNNPVRIDLSEKTAAPTKIKQELYITDHIQHKTKLLQHFLNEKGIFKGIIFSAMKINADKLAKQLRDQEISALPLHGDLKQSVRNKTIEQFRRGKVQFIVATDVAARGLDINDVSHVINFDLPKFSEDYVHRIGRTGRAGKSGVAISFALPNEARHVQKIEKYIGERIELSTIEGLEPRQGFSQAAPAKKKGGRRGGKPGGFKKKSDFKFSDRSADDRNGRKDERSHGKSFKSDRAPHGEKSFRSERAPYGDKNDRSDRAPRGEKSFRSERPPYADKNDRSDRAPQGEKSFRSERPPYGEKRSKSDRAPQGEKSFRSERPPFGEKRSKSDRAPKGEKSFRSDRAPQGEKKFRNDKAPFGEKSFKGAGKNKGHNVDRAPGDGRNFRSDKPAKSGDRNEKSRHY